MKRLPFEIIRSSIFFLFLSFFLIFFELNSREFKVSPIIVEKLQLVDPKDREILRDFFHSLFSSGDFAHTLFGNKPLALIDRCIDLKVLESSPKARLNAVVEMRGWTTWLKYQHLFPVNQYYFIGQKFPNKHFSIIFASKMHCYQVIEQHLALFKCIDQSEDKYNIILDKFIQRVILGPDKTNFPEHYFQCLGILLGYGKMNAQAFEKRSKCKDLLALAPLNLTKLPQNLRQSITLNIQHIHLPNQVYNIQPNEIIADLKALEQNYGYVQATDKNTLLFPIRTSGFMAVKDNPETVKIKLAYDSLREQLVEIYYSEKFLEIILTQLTGIQ